MARASTAALVTLILALTSAAFAQDNSGFVDMTSNETPAPAAETPGNTTATAAPKKEKRMRRRMWTIAGVSWNDSIKLKRADGAKFDVGEQVWGVTAARNWMSYKGKWGRMTQVGITAGQAAYESHDPQLDFFRNKENAYGANMAYGYYYLLNVPNIWIGGLLDVNVMNYGYHKPAGYTLEDEAFRYGVAAKLEFAFPVAKNTQIIQQLGVPLLNEGTYWLVGARFK